MCVPAGRHRAERADFDVQVRCDRVSVERRHHCAHRVEIRIAIGEINRYRREYRLEFGGTLTHALPAARGLT